MAFKTLPILTTAVFALFIGAANGDVLQEWNFDDTSGTSFSGWANSGTPGDLNFGGTDSASHATNGSGSLIVNGNVTGNSFYRQTNTMGTPVGSGLVQFSVKYNEMDFSDTAQAHLDAGGTNNNHLFGNLGFGLISNASGSNVIHSQFRLQLVGQGNPELRLQHRDGPSNTTTNYDVINNFVLADMFTIRATIDFDNANELNIYYTDGSNPEVLIDTLTYSGTSITRLQMVNQQTGGTDQWVGNDFASLDYVRLESITAIPEPSAMIVLIGAGIASLSRRRR